MYKAMAVHHIGPEITEVGPCCACGTPTHPDGVRVAMFLPFEGPPDTLGWGCIVCGLPSKGAVAILCGECFERGNRNDPEEAPMVKWICTGQDKRGRVLLDEFVDACDGELKPFEHYREMHPELTFQPGTTRSMS